MAKTQNSPVNKCRRVCLFVYSNVVVFLQLNGALLLWLFDYLLKYYYTSSMLAEGTLIMKIFNYNPWQNSLSRTCMSCLQNYLQY